MPVLFRYLLHRYFSALAIITLPVVIITYFIDVTELFRRTAEKQATTWQVLSMAMLKLPAILLEILPILILLAAFKVFYQRLELTVMRAAGQSVVQQLMPLLTASFTVGLMAATILQPMAIHGQRQYEHIEERIIGERTRQNRNPLHLSQQNKSGMRTIILASNFSSTDAKQNILQDVTILQFNDKNRLQARFNAAEGHLSNNCWRFPKVTKLTNAGDAGGLQIQRLNNYCIETDVALSALREAAANPENIPFWRLPSFIKRQFDAGFSASRYRLQWHLIVVIPVLCVAMILLGAAFSLRANSRKNIWLNIFSGTLVGFLLYFARNIITAMGMSGKLPVFLAVYAPAIIIILFSSAWLLRREG